MGIFLPKAVTQKQRLYAARYLSLKDGNMHKILTTLFCCFTLLQSFAQAQKKVSIYLWAQYNSTLYDYTLGNNPWGAGLGGQIFFNNKSKFKPTIELTGDTYVEDDKVFRAGPNGNFTENGNSFGGMVNLFAGTSFNPTQRVYLSFVAGPSFIGGQTLLGIKPSIGYSFFKNQRWTAKISYINIFNRIKLINKDFGSLSFAIGLKLL